MVISVQNIRLTGMEAMDRTKFESCNVSEQLVLVTEGLEQGSSEYLGLFCRTHDPRNNPLLTEGFDEVLSAAREHLRPLVASVLHIQKESALEFVLLLRIVGRLGVCLA